MNAEEIIIMISCNHNTHNMV